MNGGPTHEVTVTVTRLDGSDEKPTTLTTKVRCPRGDPVHVERVEPDWAYRGALQGGWDTATRYRVVVPDIETYTLTVPEPALASRVRIV